MIGTNKAILAEKNMLFRVCSKIDLTLTKMN